MLNFVSANYENIEDIINLRLIYLIEYNSGLDENIIKNLKSSMKSYLLEHLNKDCFIELAYVDNVLVSSSIINIIEKVPSPKFLNGRFGEVYGVYTNPLFRKRGLATNLIKRIISNCSNKNLSFIQLGASELGSPIYEKCGFEYCPSGYKEMKYFYK